MKKYDITLRVVDVHHFIAHALEQGAEVVRIREAPTPTIGENVKPVVPTKRDLDVRIDDEVRKSRPAKRTKHRGDVDLPDLILAALKATDNGIMTRERLLKITTAKGFAYSSLSSATSQLVRDGKVTITGPRNNRKVHLRYFRPKTKNNLSSEQVDKDLGTAELGRDNLPEIEPTVHNPENSDAG